MKLAIAAATLTAGHSAQAACDSQMTIDVPGGITGLTFVGYNVDESKIVRSTGSVRCSFESFTLLTDQAFT
jgi:hypothetical protein